MALVLNKYWTSRSGKTIANPFHIFHHTKVTSLVISGIILMIFNLRCFSAITYQRIKQQGKAPDCRLGQHRNSTKINVCFNNIRSRMSALNCSRALLSLSNSTKIDTSSCFQSLLLSPGYFNIGSKLWQLKIPNWFVWGYWSSIIRRLSEGWLK